MDSTDRFFVGIGVATIAFFIKEIVVFTFKNLHMKTVLQYDIEDVVRKFEDYKNSLVASNPTFPGKHGDPDQIQALKFRWSDGRKGFDITFKDFPFIDKSDLTASEAFYGSLGRYDQIESKYNELIIKYFLESDAGLRTNLQLLINSLHSSLVAEVDEIIRTGKTALLVINK